MNNETLQITSNRLITRLPRKQKKRITEIVGYRKPKNVGLIKFILNEKHFDIDLILYVSKQRYNKKSILRMRLRNSIYAMTSYMFEYESKLPPLKPIDDLKLPNTKLNYIDTVYVPLDKNQKQ